MKLLRLLVFIAITVPFILFSCAKQSSPSGGPKDTIPPTLQSSIPHQKQLAFKDKEIQLTFSELIILNNPKDQIIITPSVGKDYKVTAKKKTLILELDKPLKDSTTYTINFREAVQDITERNPAKNLQLAFSTTTYIDSLIIDGSVTDILTGKEIKEATVALYQPDTFNIFKHKPVYITKTNERGIFKLENLKPGKYFIYAYEDKNKNLIADSKSEYYGFIAHDTLLTKNIINLNIPIQKLDARTLKLTSARPYGTYFNLKTSKYLKDFSVTSTEHNLFASYGEDAANIKVYNTFETIDSLQIKLTATDSIGNQLDSTLYVKFSKRPADKEKFTMSIMENSVQVNKALVRAKASFNKPIKTVNYDSLFISVDSATKLKIHPDELTWNGHRTEVEIAKKIDKQLLPQKADLTKPPQSLGKKSSTPTNTNGSLSMYLGNNTFISVENDSSKKVSEPIKLIKEEETAVLLLKINTGAKNYIVQLLDKSFKLLQSYRNTPELKIDNLQPGAYIVRLVIDRNGDGQWSQGNYLKQQEPEPMTFYKTQKGDLLINLKANWEVGPLLITF